jgi:diaminopimelate epimerase
MMKFYKYHGAGNDFLLYDAREDGAVFTPSQVASLCDRHLGIGSDGLMVLSEAPGYDFKMDFFNPDGSGGMMCGNGGRCIVAFARDLGIAPQPCGAAAGVADAAAGAGDSGASAGGADGAATGASAGAAAYETAAIGCYRFLAPDGPHTAWLLCEDGPVKTVRLGMKPVTEYYPVSGIPSGWYVDTGTRHFVTFVPSVRDLDVDGLGRQIRHRPEFGPVGVNVNFVEIIAPGEIAVRTFEKGVEAETLACGTGITASALAAWLATSPAASAAPATPASPAAARHSTLVHARCHDLTVAFTPVIGDAELPTAATPRGIMDGAHVIPDLIRNLSFTDITLTGPAERVATILL